MGYYTRYELQYQIDESNKKNVDFKDKLITSLEDDSCSDYGDLMQFCIDESDEIKWYNHEDDLIAFSEKFPTVLFTLHGAGEEKGDLWVKYFKNGQMQRGLPTITFPPFDESQLK